MKKLIYLIILIFSLCNFQEACGEESSAEELKTLREEMKNLSQQIQALNEKVESQQEKIQALEKNNQQPMPEVIPPSPSTPASVWTGSFKQGLQAFNPEIGVVADVLVAISESKEDAEGNNKISVRELELVFAHDIDPYARFDSTLTLSDFEDPTIEEAYVTYWGLPFELKGRVGRMRPKVGKASALHRDALETIDEPWVVQNYFGVEGLFRTGLELSWFIPFPWDVVTHDLTVGIMEGGIGEDGTLFGETRRRPSFYSHLKNFVDISDVTNLEVGGTYLLGSSDEDSEYEVHAFGIDVTLIHYMDALHRLKVLSEFYFQNRDEAFASSEKASAEETLGEEGEALLPESFEENPWGFYTLVDYRLSQRWSLGGRFDYVIPTDIALDSPDEADIVGSAYLTFHQSEFARWRLQYQHVEFADGSDDNRIFLQGTVAVGVHKHQLQ
ncbi:MAG: hypothetical protein HYS08_00120 [Chlamydiae bacterium]|nr:hypothetical protein [Chlamydiota bacterium]MBI3266964.1 hypothetical protein [Chlamydiota bacterium]